MIPTGDASQFAIDPGKSRLTVRAFAGGLLSGFGHNPTIAARDFKGTIRFTPGSLTDASLEFQVKAETLAVQDQVSEKDKAEIERMMKEEVLETNRFPEITFASRMVSGTQLGDTMFAVRIEGDLKIHGVTRPQTVAGQLIISDETLRAYGEFALNQTDFNIKLVSVAGGTLKVKDELKLTFDIVAKKLG